MIKANPKTQATTQEQGLKGISYCPWGVYGASAGGGGMYIYPSVRFAKTKRFFQGGCMKGLFLVMCIIAILAGSCYASCTKTFTLEIEGATYTISTDCDTYLTGTTEKIDDTMFACVSSATGKRWQRLIPPAPFVPSWGSANVTLTPSAVFHHD